MPGGLSTDFRTWADIYPKNGPLQQLDIADAELKFLVKQFIDEAHLNILEDYLL